MLKLCISSPNKSAVCLLALTALIGTCLGQQNVSVPTTPIMNQSVIENSKIDVTIDLAPIKEQTGIIYVAAGAPLNISANHPANLNESLLHYIWSTKEGPIQVDQHARALVYKFLKSNEDNFIQVNVSDPKNNSSGTSKLDLTVKSPLIVADPVGKLFLEKGELLDINLIYSGSPPFKYCYKFCTPYDILPCSFCFPFFETTDTKIHIKHYLHNVGNYTLMFQIENIMNYEERHYAIKINDTARKSNLPIAPIVSSILAVCILITGVALHMRFKDTSYNTETANFDFFHDDQEDWEQELSFIQRVRYLFCGAEEDDIGDENESRYLLRKGAQYETLAPAEYNNSNHSRR